MARYHVDNRFAGTQQAIGTGYKTQVSITALTATLCRGRAVALSYSPDAAPNATDGNIVYCIQRQTAAGTATAATPNPLIPADVASRSGAFVNYTIEGTYTLPIFCRTLNQRASQQWAAQDNDAMLYWPATNIAGLAALALSPAGFADKVFFGIDYEDQ
jgi:hypothetical protein